MPKAKKPAAVNASNVIQQGQAGNLQAAQQSQGMSTVGQDSPIGSLSYTTTIDPITGLPKYQAHTNYSADQQAILDYLEMNQLGGGLTLSNLIDNAFGNYEQAPDLIGGANDLTDQALDSMDPLWERFMGPERLQRDNELRNQGILPGTPAYDQQMDRITSQQMKEKGAWLANFQPEAFKMAKSEYEEPINIATILKQLAGGPGDIKSGLVDTPAGQVNPFDILGAHNLQYQSDLKRAEFANAQNNAYMTGGLGLIGSIMGMPVNPSKLTLGGKMLGFG